MNTSLNNIYTFLTSNNFWLFCELSSLLFKSYLLFALTKFAQKIINKKLYFLLIIFLISSIIYSNISNIPFNIYWTYNKIFDFRIVAFSARLGWLFSIIQTQSLVLLFHNLANPKFKITTFNFMGIAIGLLLGLSELYFIIFEFNTPALTGFKLKIETQLAYLELIYMVLMLIPAFFNVFNQIRNKTFPKILARQLQVLMYGLIVPFIALEFISNELILYPLINIFIPLSKNLIQSLSTILISYALYYFTKKIVGLRFLNLRDHVESKETFNFTNDFNNVLEQLSCITMPYELVNVVQFFFQQAFNIQKAKTELYLDFKHSNAVEIEKKHLPTNNSISNKIENFLADENNAINCYINQNKILIKDEIEFSNFYEKSENRTEVINFLNAIDADIFLPIYEGKNLSSCIIVEQHARTKKLYNTTERDEMLIFSSYLSNVINILKRGDFEAKIKKEKDLEDELYKKHQEINQYKESLKVLLKNNEEKKIGIIFYKNHKFSFANQFAHGFINLDLNKDLSHPLRKEINELTTLALKYKFAHKVITNESAKISLYAITGPESNTVIILAQKLAISEIIKSYFDLLKNPSLWDYLIYLETTESGRLISSLIPGSSQNLLDLKVELLSIALSKKATLIQCQEEDTINIVEIIHNISLRQKLHIINLPHEEKNNEIAIKLLGINSIFGQNGSQDSILENLDKVGTLFIKNVELLSIETQNLLAEFISYGYFKKLKSLSKIFSDVRIIFSSKKNLQKLTNESQFSPSLFEQLKKSKLYLPSLNLLSEVDLLNLIEHYATDASIQDNEILKLENKDLMKILSEKPNSLHKLKERINSIISSKSTKHSLERLYIEEDITDPHLAEAINSGKRALKNQRLLQVLWDKYKNQSKIASMLNVHRSSVSRRFEEYGIN